MTTARPILFSAPMIRALLDGSKTQTRRIVKQQERLRLGHDVLHRGDTLPEYRNEHGGWQQWVPNAKTMRCPYGAPGDVLWVRETWCINGFPSTATSPEHCYFAASDEAQAAHDGDGFTIFNKDGSERSPWKPSIHMPRWASRLTLQLTDVRIERLQDISEQDAIAEGCGPVIADDLKTHPLAKHIGPAPVNHYAALWERINGETGPRSWDANPWVWALTFNVNQQNIDAYLNSRSADA